jgi:hypothetical protein
MLSERQVKGTLKARGAAERLLRKRCEREAFFFLQKVESERKFHENVVIDSDNLNVKSSMKKYLLGDPQFSGE